MTKQELRRLLIKKRKSLSTAEWSQKSDRLCSHIESSPLFASASTILAYFSFRQEPDLSPLFAETSSTVVSEAKTQTQITTKSWGFPRCVDKKLVWHYWKPGDSLISGAFGILEPDPNAPIVSPAEVDLILVPAVACDLRGYRLGYGGGFYDRLLSSPEWVDKPTIGIVFEFARLPELPIDPWDRPLQEVCTETGFLRSNVAPRGSQ